MGATRVGDCLQRCRRHAGGRVRPRTLHLAAACLAVSLFGVVRAGEADSRAARARVANVVSLSDIAHLHKTGHHGFTLNEEGSASGTISGTINIHLNIDSVDRVTAEVGLYPSRSSITGHATASYRSAGPLATFSGTMTIERGTGRYKGAYGSGLSFTGTVQRSNDAVTVHVSGRMSI